MLRTLLHQQGALAAENDKLRLLIQRLTRHQSGRWSEQLTPTSYSSGWRRWNTGTMRKCVVPVTE